MAAFGISETQRKHRQLGRESADQTRISANGCFRLEAAVRRVWPEFGSIRDRPFSAEQVDKRSIEALLDRY